MGDGSQGHFQDLGDFPVRQSFGAEVEALAVLLQQGVDNRRQAVVFALGGEPLFGIRTWILMQIRRGIRKRITSGSCSILVPLDLSA